MRSDKMYTKILLAVDGSDHSIRATKETIKITSLSKDSMIEVVYVVDFAKTKADVLHSYGSEDLEVARRKKLLPVEELLKLENLTYQLKILRGDPGPAIVEYANKEQIDLVIIGSRGLNSLQEMVLGSVSHKVVKRVRCPVLIVK